MKELTVRDMDGNTISMALLNVDGEDFTLNYHLPVVVYLSEISLIDDEETRKAKEERGG